jgi:exodeoxyribonuclease III
VTKTLRIASWNINSVRTRIDLLGRVAKALTPDVLCLQEIKCAPDDFPTAACERLGFAHQLVRGVRGQGGTAILSRAPFVSTGGLNWCERTDGRHAIATVDGNIEVHCFYVPAGVPIPDPVANPKFAHKLRFLDEMAVWSKSLARHAIATVDGNIEVHCFYVPAGVPIPDPVANPKFAHKLRFLDEMAVWSKSLARRAGRRIVVGDLNVAPLPTDVWSHKQTLKDVSHTPAETERLEKIRSDGKWVDAMRHFVPPEEKLFTWWSYRATDWLASNRGRRLDHAWVTPSLAPALKAMTVLKDARGWPGPSDHVPVLIELAV